MEQEKQQRHKLTSIELAGFKSIDSEGQKIEFGDVTVLIGANGTGKSNLISFFSLLGYMMTGSLQEYIGVHGFADSHLYYSSKTTDEIEATVRFDRDPDSWDRYNIRLIPTIADTLLLKEECISWNISGYEEPKVYKIKYPKTQESGLQEAAQNHEPSRIVYNLLRKCQVFQFHDTSLEAKVRKHGYIEDAHYLRNNAGNLAAYLLMLSSRTEWEPYYHRIISYIRSVFPQFNTFDLQPSPRNEQYISLNWKEVGSDYLFGPHQISDGTLRFMALSTLLLQPPDKLPSVIILDEPELGLHPVAISALASMIRIASQHAQVILATQSPRFVDEFDVSDIVVAERNNKMKRSEFKRLNEDELADWLDQYSISELWEKNVIGGRP